MENTDQTHSSIDALRRHESMDDYAERQRFIKALQSAADRDPVAAAWLKEHFDAIV